ncbi:MAG: NAD(P)H-dependent glycerol-3-phosphate dehydrogenase [Acidobacteriota bacterium]
MSRVAVLGAGSWGTALAVHAAGQGHEVRLVCRGADAAATLARDRENRTYLRHVPFPDALQATADASGAVSDAELILVVTPVKGLELAARWLAESREPGRIVICCAKGIRPDSLETPAAFLRTRRPDLVPAICVLSGPTFAAELAKGHPTAAVVAADDVSIAARVQRELAGGALRLYASNDPIGVELGGALKNVMALAAGVVDGLGYGTNTRAALVTRGLSELTRLAVACGAAAGTLSGLAGMGDLILTCSGSLSRNRHVGVELGKGRSLAEITDAMHMVAEGVATTRAALELSRRESVEMPIVEQVASILFDGRAPAAALNALLARDLTTEDGAGIDASRV